MNHNEKLNRTKRSMRAGSRTSKLTFFVSVLTLSGLSMGLAGHWPRPADIEFAYSLNSGSTDLALTNADAAKSRSKKKNDRRSSTLPVDFSSVMPSEVIAQKAYEHIDEAGRVAVNEYNRQQNGPNGKPLPHWVGLYDFDAPERPLDGDEPWLDKNLDIRNSDEEKFHF